MVVGGGAVWHRFISIIQLVNIDMAIMYPIDNLQVHHQCNFGIRSRWARQCRIADCSWNGFTDTGVTSVEIMLCTPVLRMLYISWQGLESCSTPVKINNLFTRRIPQ